MKKNNSPTPTHLTKRLLNIDEAAAYIGRTPGALRQLIYRGGLPVVKLDRRVQIDREDLDKLIDGSKVRETVF